MIFVPLPFVVTILIGILIARTLAGRRSTREPRPLLGPLVVYGVLSLVIGLRWGYGFQSLSVVQPVLAAAGLSLTVSAFRDMAGKGSPTLGRFLETMAPPLGVAVLVLIVPMAVGPVLIALFAAAGVTLARLSLGGADALPRTAFDEAPFVHRSLQATAAAFLLSAVVDIAVELDFHLSGGAHVGTIVAFANVPVLLALGVTAAVAGRRPVPDAPSASAQAPLEAPDHGGDAAVMARLETAMRERGFYRDPDLTLERLSRRLAVPARQISGAVNRVCNENVSQYVNAHRVREAQRLLESTEKPVTQIMFESGFQTKSNFNREFRRVAACSPSDWRGLHRKGSDPILPIPP